MSNKIALFLTFFVSFIQAQEVTVIDALTSGRISGVGLDCYQDEPGGNPKFSNFKNIFMLPHIGSATVKTRDAMGFRALDNLDSYFAGKTPEDLL